jgi:hypothetical protein
MRREVPAMTAPRVSILLLVVTAAFSLLTCHAANAQSQDVPQTPATEESDPLTSLTSAFPNTITLKKRGHLLEFCPDNTCDGFVSRSSVPVPELKDFAYLYVYFFSEYIYLPDWRTHADAKDAAQRILSRPEYASCRMGTDIETARCVLLRLSKGERIKLIFVRYDENRRNVVPEDIRKELTRKHAVGD